ncbi:uridine diphosphate glucose pyrophosphatase NUDT22 [Astyanax mexicanus]|uniref:uridine diphosphate glucose pyrophosphatase NUDT22 n=1 Tax=Astyanax mexicanus TaxID=7994 RepID=UPI0020CB5851|nr:uridine diphosphate glucose pyrophosphatase NUDT22 [Astyanax mexicanus]
MDAALSEGAEDPDTYKKHHKHPMDPEVSVMLHCAPSQGLEEHQIRAEISTRFNRRSSPEIEKHIEAVWNDRVTKEPWLFNGAKFRLHSAELSTSIPSTSMNCVAGDEALQALNSDIFDSENQLEGCRAEESSPAPVITSENTNCERNSCCKVTTEEPQKGTSAASRRNASKHQALLSLQLGLTCYKDFLGTNWSQEALNLQKRGDVEVGDPQAFLAQPLGVGAVMVTSDGQVVMLRRSQKVAEAAGLIDIPGGHPEPKAVCQGVSEEAISVDLMQDSERAVISEIFSSVCAEIRDEVNVPLSFLSAPVLMGIALNHTSAGRPSAEFYIRCSLTMEEVKDFYWRGGPEAHESTDIVFVNREEMQQLDESASLWSELCPSAKGAVLLYRLVRPDGV